MRDMKDAPRDGTRIIVWDGQDGLLQCAHWSDIEGVWFICDDRDYDGGITEDIIYVSQPMGWVPLPDEAREEN